MKNRFEACLQAIHYLLKNFGPMDKLKVVKLLYLADKKHLIRLDRTITGDCYFAMRHGPVGSMALNILDKSMEYLEPEQCDFIDRYIRQVELGRYDYECVSDDMYYGQLSESDKGALDDVAEMFKGTDKWDLVNLTHKYPEWAQFGAELEKDPTISKPMPLVDFFSCLPNDPLGLDPEVVKISRAFFLGVEDQGDIQ